MHEFEGTEAGHFLGHVASNDGYSMIAEYDTSVDEVPRDVLVLGGFQKRKVGYRSFLYHSRNTHKDYVVVGRVYI